MDTSSGGASVFVDVLESEAGGGAAGGSAPGPAAVGKTPARSPFDPGKRKVPRLLTQLQPGYCALVGTDRSREIRDDLRSGPYRRGPPAAPARGPRDRD